MYLKKKNVQIKKYIIKKILLLGHIPNNKIVIQL